MRAAMKQIAALEAQRACQRPSLADGALQDGLDTAFDAIFGSKAA